MYVPARHFLCSRGSVEVGSAHIHVDNCGSGRRTLRTGVNFMPPGILEIGHRALPATEPVPIRGPLRGAAPYTFLRNASRNMVYRSLALKTAKQGQKSGPET